MILGRARVRLVQAGTAVAAAALIAGCGNPYRPVITPVNPSGPAAQPGSYAVVVSAPAPTSPGIVTILDYSGDTVMVIAPIGPGPRAFATDQFGSVGYTLDSDGTLANFPISTSLQAKNVTYSTLPSAASPVNLMVPQAALWAADLNGNVADVFSGSPASFQRAIPVPPTPVTIVGSLNLQGQREYVISQNFTDPTGIACNTAPGSAPAAGIATPIELSTLSADTPIPLGKCPVYAVQSPDQKRVFVLNRGDDTITVINGQTDQLDRCVPYQNLSGQWITCHRTLPLSTSAVTALKAADPTYTGPPNGTSGMPATAGPVYAEYSSVLNELVVADYAGGTISIIDVGLDSYGNDANTYANPDCTVNGVTSYANCGAITGGFGTTYTIPVGNYPASVTVLADGSRAYTANQGDGTVDGTVTIANLSSHTVEKTLTVVGHPRTVVSTQNSLYGKVYVASPDSPYLTILATLTDLVDTTVLVEGNVVDVRVTTQNGSGTNFNANSRVPGYGEPCNQPPTSGNPTPAPTGTQTLLEACQAIP
jgi:DNA-binding beta-propeller fold protein YncE